MKAIDIVKTPQHKLLEAIEEQKAWDAHIKDTEIAAADNSRLIQELYSRGVKLKDIFGLYYEMEVASDARTIDVEDMSLTVTIRQKDLSF